MADFCVLNPTQAATWHRENQYLIILEVPDLAALEALTARASAGDIASTPYREPDYDDQVTAVAFMPGAATRRLLSSLPCAGRSHLVADSVEDIRNATQDLEPEITFEGAQVDIEWENAEGCGHLIVTPTRYTGYIANRARTAENAHYIKGSLRDLSTAWPTFESHLRASMKTSVGQENNHA